MTPTADELLASVEPLTFGDRCRRLAELRSYAGSDELRDLLFDLGTRGHYERSLALFIASATRDEASLDLITQLMRDPAADLAAKAVGWAARVGVPAERFEALLEDAPSAVRSATYRAIRKHQLSDLAERLVSGVAERWGQAEAAGLLAVCGEGLAQERLGDLAHALPNWGTLGHAHPGRMLDHAEKVLADTPQQRRVAWWTWHGTGVAEATPYAPERVVTLLERYWGAEPLPYALVRWLGVLLKADPPRMLALLLNDAHRPQLAGLLSSRRVLRQIVSLDDAGILARAVRDDTRTLARLLKAAPPSRRDALFIAAMQGIDLSAVELSSEILDVLPHEARAREARRMLGLRRIAAQPPWVWRLTSYLPYDSAEPVLAELTQRPDGDERAVGYQLLAECAGRSRSPEVLGRLLDTRLNRLRNEQDPVRLSFVSALAAMPVSMLRASHAPALRKIAEDALDARDLSYGTRHALMRLAVALCRQGAVGADRDLLPLGFDLLRMLTHHDGTINVGRLHEGLPTGREREIGRVLADYLEKAGLRDDHRLVFALAWALDKRAANVPEIQDGLERAALEAHDDGAIRQAIELWLRPSATRSERVARVLERDASTVLIPSVLAVVCTRRTDLLHLVLRNEAPPGRFRHPNVRYVPLASPAWTYRWTARQRAEYIALLHRVAGNVHLPEHERTRAISVLGRIPDATADDLRRYFGSGSMARVALTSVVWLPSPQDLLPELLDLASSDDAHVAMAAASRAARFVPPSALTGVLAPVLLEGKITARKEAVRILLRNRVPDALAAVEAAWDAPDQHRDVRAAIASALRDRIGTPSADRILREAALGPRDLARQIIDGRPYMISVENRPRYAALVMTVARSSDPEAALAALPTLGAWASFEPGIPVLLSELVTQLDSYASAWRSALSSLVPCALNGVGTPELIDAARTLAGLDSGFNASEERDLPALQRLTELTAQVRTWYGNDRTYLDSVVDALVDVLPEPLASELLAATVDWHTANLPIALDALVSRPLGGVLATEHVALSLTIGRVSRDLDDDGYWSSGRLPSPELVLPQASRLAARADTTSGLFACALTAHHGPEAGWPPEWRTILRKLRTHPKPDVAYRAHNILTAEE